MSEQPVNWPNHTAAWREWRNAMSSARMHHGWILAGKKGLGKFDFALAAARELVAEEGIPQPEGDHPDISVLTYGPKTTRKPRRRPMERSSSGLAPSASAKSERCSAG